MSWTDVFPVYNNDAVAFWKKTATLSERRQIKKLFAIKEIKNQSPAPHLIVFSVYWQNSDLDATKSDAAELAQSQRLTVRVSPKKHYIQLLLDGIEKLRLQRPNVGIRIYVANDMEFLSEQLLAFDCEVCIMAASSSVQKNPGSMWRFLALSETNRLITLLDISRADDVKENLDCIDFTESVARTGLAFWRIPVCDDVNKEGYVAYRPISSKQFGACRALPVGQLLESFVWHSMRTTKAAQCYLPGCQQTAISGSLWPHDEFDEWFLLSAIYPRAAKHGFLSCIPASAISRILPLDIEYCTWSNPSAEIVFFGENASCCNSHIKPKPVRRRPAKTAVRANCSVIQRRSTNDIQTTKAPPLITDAKVLRVDGMPEAAIEIALVLETKWWIDLSSQLIPNSSGSELFLDSCLESCDLAICDWTFEIITPSLAQWAHNSGLNSNEWIAGCPVKIPQLDTLTLWNREFSRTTLKEWIHAGRPCSLGIFLEFKRQRGLATIAECSLKNQGWTRPLR